MPTPDYEPPLLLPTGTESGVSNTIWTPTNVRYIQSWLIGTYIDDDGNKQEAWKHEFELNYMGRQKTFGVMAEGDVSDAQIEDMAAGVSERTAAQIRVEVERQGGKLRPEDLAVKANWKVRRDLAAAWRDYRRWAKKRRASTTGKTIFGGLS